MNGGGSLSAANAAAILIKRAKRLKTKGIYFLYRVLQAFGLPVLLLYFLFRGLRNRGYWRSLPQRFGFLPRSFRQTGPGAIWLHAVSVGEVLACVEFLRRLAGGVSAHAGFSFPPPRWPAAPPPATSWRGLADGVFYAPVDYVFAVRRVLRALRPSVVVVAETEIWPNLFREKQAHRRRRWLWSTAAFPTALFRATAAALVFRRGAAGGGFHSGADGRDARAVRGAGGAARADVRVGGQFQVRFRGARAPRPDSPVARLLDRAAAGARCGSPPAPCRPPRAGDVDEDDAVIAAFQRAGARHPGPAADSGAAQAGALRRGGRQAGGGGHCRTCGARALGGSRDAGACRRVLLLDTIGELSGLFAVADVVFMGGTLARRGGHNILEPAFFAKPVIAGPHMENFQAIADEFRAAGAYVEIGAPADWPARWSGCWKRRERRARLGSARAWLRGGARAGPRRARVAQVRELYARCRGTARRMPWFAVACGAGAAVGMGRAKQSAARLCPPPQAGCAGDRRGQPHHGRHRQDALRAAAGGAPEGARAQAGDSDARLRPQLAPASTWRSRPARW